MAKLKNLYYKWQNAKAIMRYTKNVKLRSQSHFITRNTIYHNLHFGKRCFILGNGPSLKKEDLCQLKNEIVFTVNQASRLPQFNSLQSNYHFWADPNFFKINKCNSEDLELLNTMISIGENNPELQCFFPLQQECFIERFELEKYLNVNYFYSGLNMYDGYKKQINYSKPVLAFGTVVQWCITMAIYMGIKEIYLLGCDNTGIVTTVKSILHQNDNNDYSYAVTENEKIRMEKMLENSSLEAYLLSYIRTIQDYRRLQFYCQKRSIKLINCSSETVIDSIPRKKLTDVLNSK